MATCFIEAKHRSASSSFTLFHILNFPIWNLLVFKNLWNALHMGRKIVPSPLLPEWWLETKQQKLQVIWIIMGLEKQNFKKRWRCMACSRLLIDWEIKNSTPFSVQTRFLCIQRDKCVFSLLYQSVIKLSPTSAVKTRKKVEATDPGSPISSVNSYEQFVYWFCMESCCPCCTDNGGRLLCACTNTKSLISL